MCNDNKHIQFYILSHLWYLCGHIVWDFELKGTYMNLTLNVMVYLYTPCPTKSTYIYWNYPFWCNIAWMLNNVNNLNNIEQLVAILMVILCLYDLDINFNSLNAFCGPQSLPLDTKFTSVVQYYLV